MTKKKLLISALTKFLAGIVLMGLVLFLPAGTWNYSNAWLFLGLLFIPMLILGIVLFLKAPELLEKRLQSKEKESTQKGVVAASGLMFIGAFVLAGLDFRFGWTNVPAWVVILAAVILLQHMEEGQEISPNAKRIWLTAAALFFVLLLPVISGIPVSEGYARFVEYVLPGGLLFHGAV